MKMTRRGFVGTVGLGSAAGLLASAGLTSKKANAASSYEAQAVYDGGIMQLNQNEVHVAPVLRQWRRFAPMLISVSVEAMRRIM